MDTSETERSEKGTVPKIENLKRTLPKRKHLKNDSFGKETSEQ